MSQAQPEPDPPSDAAADDGSSHRRRVAGAAVGIGSAAIVAALLFANRGKPAKPSAAKNTDPADR